MSRTLVHTPVWTWLHRVEILVPDHRHGRGPCDLPPVAEWSAWARHNLRHGDEEPPWRCGWDLNRRRIPPLCGCRTCTAHHWRRLDRRAERHDAKRLLRTGRWAAEYE